MNTGSSGMHGAIRTGRPFTGDYAGILPYDTLHPPLRLREQAGLGRAWRRAAPHPLPQGFTLHDSYHCSRYNTQTKRLTPGMFRAVFSQIVKHLNAN